MDEKELTKIKLAAEDWLTRSDQDRAYEGSAMPEAQANGMAKTVLKLLETVRGYDLERKTYYDSFKLVKDDWNKLKAALFKLAPTLKAFRESDHSYDRAPTAEGQAVLDAWDEVSQVLG